MTVRPRRGVDEEIRVSSGPISFEGKEVPSAGIKPKDREGENSNAYCMICDRLYAYSLGLYTKNRKI